MRRVIGLVLGVVFAATFLGGCAVYADPYSFRASVGVPGPAPAGHYYYRDRGWRRGY
jgi:hypothetical protein